MDTRTDLGAALTELRTRAGLTIRDVVDRSGALHGTVSGWFSGQHVPTRASFDMFESVLAVCGVADREVLSGWREAAQRARFTPGHRGAKHTAPYKGLDSFQQSDAALYFGRAELVDDILARLAGKQGHSSPTLAVLGASGAGKSSLLRAGVAAAVAAGRAGFAGWSTVVLTPGAEPTAALTGALSSLGPGAEAERTAVFVDQLEELWSQCADPQARGVFLEALFALPGLVVLGLRADFYGEAARVPRLRAVLRDNPVLLGPMSVEALRQVIVAPAEQVGVAVDEDLVDVLLEEFSPRDSWQPHDEGALPLLSHALLRTWELSPRKRLRLADYRATGGIRGAVKQSAEGVFASLDARQQECARLFFQRLVTVEGQAETRRRLPLAELADDCQGAGTVVARFAESRLVTVARDSVEITHESLLLAWPRLREWIDGNREWLVAHRALTLAAQSWVDSGRESSALLGAGRLEMHSAWLAEGDNAASVNAVEREFLQTSAAHLRATAAAEHRRVAMLRRMVVALAVFAVLALVATTTAVLYYRTAWQQTAMAQAAQLNAESVRDQALSRQLAGESERLYGDDPALAAQLALYAYSIAPTVEATSALLDSSAADTPTRIVGPVGAMHVAVSPDGTTLAGGFFDGTVRLYQVSEGGVDPVEVASFNPQGGDFSAPLVAFAPGGEVLVAGGEQGASLWRLAGEGSAVRPVRSAELDLGAAAGAHDFVFSPDGRVLAAHSSTGEVLLWDVGHPPVPVPLPTLPALEPPNRPVGALAFSPDGRVLAVGGAAGSVHLWQWSADGEPHRPAPQRLVSVPLAAATAVARDLEFSPDGRVLAAATTNAEVQLWDTANPAAPQELPSIGGFNGYVNAVGFSPDGRSLVVGSADQATQLWDYRAALMLGSLPGPAAVGAVRFSPDGGSVFVGSDDGTARVWSLGGPVLGAFGGPVFELDVDAGRQRMLVAVGRGDRGVYVWDTAQPGREAQAAVLRVPPDMTLTTVADLSADGRRAVAATFHGDVFLWDVTDPREPRRHGPFHPHGASDHPHGHGIGTLDLTPDGATMFVGDVVEGEVQVWDVRDPAAARAVATLNSSAPATASALTADGSRLYVANDKGAVVGWEVADPGAIRALPVIQAFSGAVKAVTVSADGRSLAVSGADHHVQLWDVSDPQAPRMLADLTGPNGRVHAVRFSGDGRMLAAASGDKRVWLWDVSNREAPVVLASLAAYGTPVNAVEFLTGGGLVVGGYGSNVRRWSTDLEAVVGSVCATRGTPLTAAEQARYLPGRPPADPCG